MSTKADLGFYHVFILIVPCYPWTLVSRHIVESSNQKTFQTGHEIFDRIVSLRFGSSIMVLDKTFSEAYSLMNLLLTKYGPSNRNIVEIRPSSIERPTVHVIDINTSLIDMSINLKQLREANPRSVLLHLYLPSLLVRHRVDHVLELVEMWVRSAYENGAIEFYFIPKDTFPDFEKRMLSLVDGALEVRVEEQQEGSKTSMVATRCCPQEFHLRPVQYTIREERLLFEWGGILRERIPTPHSQALENKTRIEMNLETLLIERGKGPPPLSPRDYLFLVQIVGKRTVEVFQLFQDKWEDTLQKLSEWASDDTIRLTDVARVDMDRKNYLSNLNRFALSLPTTLSSALIHIQRRYLRRRRTIPVDAYVALENAAEAVCELIGPEPERGKEILKQMQIFFGEFAGRVTAVQYLNKLEGDPTVKISEDRICKIISLTLYGGFGIKSQVEADARGGFKVKIKDCIFCESAKPGRPCCEDILAGPIVGCLGVIFKRQFRCYESECKTTGGRECTLTVVGAQT